MNTRRKVASARIDMRISPDLKYFLEFAALIGGYDSLSNFMAKASEISAKKIFDEIENSRNLSSRDSELLLKFLQNAPEPNASLKAAYAKVLEMHQLDDSGRSIYNIDSNLIKKPLEKTKPQGRNG